ncbi:MAG: VOC family protein [Gammaproteobacteria bacterium]|nr:VOC family protein [Gammaproteobacteria bacterium]
MAPAGGRTVRIDHVSVVVEDVGGALTFYEGILGLAVDHGRPDLGYPGAWLDVGGQQIHLLQVPNPDPISGRPAHGGRDRHIALRVADLEGLEDRLEAAGVPYTPSRSGRAALFCRDPDGNAVELIAE